MVYLDNCATTPPDARVIETMARVSVECFGNASSQHGEGRRAARVLSESRETVAASIQAQPREIVFTCSGTESNNSVIWSAVQGIPEQGSVHIVTSSIEHASVRNRLASEKQRLGSQLEVTELAVSTEGRIDPDALARAIRPNTRLITLIHCNNETGVLQDLESILKVKLANPHVLLHLDIVQSYLKYPFDVRTMPIDFLTASAHKIHGPRGIGFLYVRNGLDLHPLLVGGAQEKFRRAGTENVPAAAGFAEAVTTFPVPFEFTSQMSELEREFLHALRGHHLSFELNGPAAHSERMPGFLNLSFEGVASKEDLQIALDIQGVQVSSTSACHSGIVAPSHVLKAMAVPDANLANGIRIVFNRYQSLQDISDAAEQFGQVIQRIKAPTSVV